MMKFHHTHTDTIIWLATGFARVILYSIDIGSQIKYHYSTPDASKFYRGSLSEINIQASHYHQSVAREDGC